MDRRCAEKECQKYDSLHQSSRVAFIGSLDIIFIMTKRIGSISLFCLMLSACSHVSKRSPASHNQSETEAVVDASPSDNMLSLEKLIHRNSRDEYRRHARNAAAMFSLARENKADPVKYCELIKSAVWDIDVFVGRVNGVMDANCFSEVDSSKAVTRLWYELGDLNKAMNRYRNATRRVKAELLPCRDGRGPNKELQDAIDGLNTAFDRWQKE